MSMAMSTVTVSPRVALNPRQPQVSRSNQAPGSTGVRLTTRGRRLARTLIIVMALLVTVGVAIFGHISESQASSAHASVTTSTVIVQPGQTMWGLAERIAPNDDPRETIARIADLNGLAGDAAATVYPGQRLVIPAAQSHRDLCSATSGVRR